MSWAWSLSLQWLDHLASASISFEWCTGSKVISMDWFSRIFKGGTYQKLWILPDVTMKYRGFLDSAHSPISEMILMDLVCESRTKNPGMAGQLAIPVKCHEQLAALSSQASGICVVLKQSEDCRMILRVPSFHHPAVPAVPVSGCPSGKDTVWEGRTAPAELPDSSAYRSLPW